MELERSAVARVQLLLDLQKDTVGKRNGFDSMICIWGAVGG